MNLLNKSIQSSLIAKVILTLTIFALILPSVSAVAIDPVTHGSISIVFDGDQDNGFLRVKGEAPEGTYDINILVRDENRNIYLTPVIITPK